MSSVYFDPGLGGDGSTVSDDGHPVTGLANGGHRSRFVPAMGNVIAIGRTAVNAATAAAASINAATYGGTSTSDIAVGLGNKTLTTQAGKGWFVGQWLQLIAGNNAWMVGQVTRYSGTTLELVVSWSGGTGTLSGWTIMPGSPWNVDSAQVSAKIAELAAWQAKASLDWPFHRATRNQFGNVLNDSLVDWQTFRTKIKVTVKRDIPSGVAWAARDEEERTILNAMGLNQAVYFMPHIRVLRMTWEKQPGTDAALLPFQVLPVRQVITMASYARLVSGALNTAENGMYLSGVTPEWGLCGTYREPANAGEYLHMHPFCLTETGEVEVILPGAVVGRFPLDRAKPRWGWFDHRSAATNLDTAL